MDDQTEEIAERRALIRKRLLDHLHWVQVRLSALDEIENKLKTMKLLAEQAALDDVSAQKRIELDRRVQALAAEVEALDTMSRPLVCTQQQ